MRVRRGFILGLLAASLLGNLILLLEHSVPYWRAMSAVEEYVDRNFSPAELKEHRRTRVEAEVCYWIDYKKTPSDNPVVGADHFTLRVNGRGKVDLMPGM